MRLDARLLAACSLLLVTACGGSSSSGSQSGFQTAIQGTWGSGDCLPTGASASGRVSLVISGTSVNVTLTQYPSTDCTGTGVAVPFTSGTITVGNTVTTSLGGSSVTAYQINITEAGTTTYDIGYVDTAATPDRLYTGDTSGTNDGSTSALRPTTLDDTVYFTKQ